MSRIVPGCLDPYFFDRWISADLRGREEPDDEEEEEEEEEDEEEENGDEEEEGDGGYSE